MNDTALLVIAVAVAIMAASQLGGLIYVARMAKRIDAIVGRFESDIKPVIAKLNAASSDAQKVAAIAAGQVERLDRTITDLSARVDHTVTVLSRRLTSTTRESAALWTGLKVGVLTLRELQRRRRGARAPGTGFDDDDPLFIG